MKPRGAGPGAGAVGGSGELPSAVFGEVMSTADRSAVVRANYLCIRSLGTFVAMEPEPAATRAAVEALGLLAEDARLRVVSAQVLGARTVEAIAKTTGLDTRVVLKSLGRLETGGLVTHSDGEWSVLTDRLRDLVRAATPEVSTGDEGIDDPGAAAVLRAFIRDGRLISIPAAHAKRLVVLDHVVRIFEPGVRYPEREVNALLRAFHPDCAALRRYLVDEGFLERADRVYWRIGGAVEV